MSAHSESSGLDPGHEIAVRMRLACEAHDPTIVAHLDHVTRCACELARIAGLDAARVDEIFHATPLHDIGKIGLPREILEKPGRLTAEEMQIVVSHTTIGHRILDGSTWPVIQCAARIALGHHENWDGSGYPHKLRGNDIPIDARIVAIADVYDALLSRRAYKPAWNEDAVLTEMQRLRGVKFDPGLLDLFLANLARINAPAA